MTCVTRARPEPPAMRRSQLFSGDADCEPFRLQGPQLDPASNGPGQLILAFSRQHFVGRAPFAWRSEVQPGDGIPARILSRHTTGSNAATHLPGGPPNTSRRGSRLACLSSHCPAQDIRCGARALFSVPCFQLRSPSRTIDAAPARAIAWAKCNKSARLSGPSIAE